MQFIGQEINVDKQNTPGLLGCLLSAVKNATIKKVAYHLSVQSPIDRGKVFTMSDPINAFVADLNVNIEGAGSGPLAGLTFAAKHL